MNQRPKYAMVPRGDRHTLHATYDIVDNSVGAERVLADSVRYEPALEIVDALNAMARMIEQLTTGVK